MGIASTIGLINGDSDVKTPGPARVGRDYLGLLNAYLGSQGNILGNEQTYRPQYNQLVTQNLAALLPQLAGILTNAAPGVSNVVRGINPGQTNLLATLTQQAQQELDSGAALDPALARVTQQSIRGGQAARGLGYGPADVLQESSALTSLGEGLRRNRQAFAGNVAQMNNQYDTAPTLQLLAELLSGSNSIQSSSGPTLTPSAVSSNLLTMPYQGRLAAHQASAANRMGLYNTIDQTSSQFLSSLIGSSMGGGGKH